MDSKKPKTKGLHRENPYLPRNHEHLVATETAPSSRLNISTNLWSPVVSGADSAIGCSRTPLNHGARPQPFALAFTKPFAIRRLSATFATCPWTSPMLTAPLAESPSSRAPTTIVPNATSLCADYASRASSKWTLSTQAKTGTGPEEKSNKPLMTPSTRDTPASKSSTATAPPAGGPSSAQELCPSCAPSPSAPTGDSPPTGTTREPT